MRGLLLLGLALLSAPDCRAQSPQPEEAKVVAQDAMAYDAFGEAVAISGDLAVVGAPGALVTQGAVYVYEKVQGTWTQQAKLTGSDSQLGDLFGHAVALDGERLVVGARWASSPGGLSAGKVYVFDRVAGVWLERAVLTAPDGQDYDFFGWSVDVSGDRFIAGAPARNLNRGGAYVFRRNGSQWVHELTLTAPDEADGDQLGSSVALDGDRAAVGAPFDDDGEPSAGAVYVFTRASGLWAFEQKLTSPAPTPYAKVGSSVDVDGDRVAAGATERALSAPPMTGSVCLFRFDGAAWSHERTLRPSAGAVDDGFGNAVALDGERLVVGSERSDDGGLDSGSVYVFERVFGTWRESARLLSSDLAAGDTLGDAVALDGEQAFVGVPGDGDSGAASGAGYLFRGTEPGNPTCYGDGSGSPCPCGNVGAPGQGCAHRGGYGMEIHGYGTRRASADDLELLVTGVPPGNTGLFYVGPVLAGNGAGAFDGLQCLTGGLHLYAPVFQQDGAVLGTDFIALGGGVPAAGGTFYFQYWTRDAAGGGSPCGARANFSPAYAVTFLP